MNILPASRKNEIALCVAWGLIAGGVVEDFFHYWEYGSGEFEVLEILVPLVKIPIDPSRKVFLIRITWKL
jgi:hypothetical protein